jgi:SWI/SNF-related matrix-associated actin-dependent regulator 1 of chromatin subfamily A
VIITSKFGGVCKVCSCAIKVGDRIEWTRGSKLVAHARCSDEGKAEQAAIAESRRTDVEAPADFSVPVPDGLSYLPYQRAGISYALAPQRSGTLIADEMGLGKTIQAIGVINGDESIRHVLVICPASLRLNWAREFKKWLTRAATIVVAGLGRGGGPLIAATGGDIRIRIVNYNGLAKRLRELVSPSLNAPETPWDLVIVDEAHYCKNDRAQRTQHVLTIGRNAKRRVALTGTPICNRPKELFPLLRLVAPAVWDPAGKDRRTGKEYPEGSGRGRFRFERRYCAAYFDGKRWDAGGATNLEELQDKLRATCMIRRLKADVLTELPPKRRQIIELEGGDDAVDEERRLWSRHEGELERLREDVELARAAESEDDYTAAVNRLRSGTGLAFTEIAKVRRETAMAKVEQVIEHVREVFEGGTEKLVLFAHHKDLIAKLAKDLAEFGVVTLTGDTPMLDRQAAVDRFQQDASCRLFIGSITAAGVGLTLTAASHVIFAELDWVPGNVTQAEDRCHRIGQRNSVLVQHLVLAGSLDAQMARTLVAKQEIADSALDKERAAIAAEPALPTAERAATEGKRAELDKVAAELTPAQIAAIHEALRMLARRCNGAATEDGSGFAKIDVRIGHSLAQSARLTPRQAALGQRLVRKYRRQLGELVEACGLESQAA